MAISNGNSDVKPEGEAAPRDHQPQPVVHPDFPDAKTLLISYKRPRHFLERSARELLAGGTDVIILSALGDAIPLCVQLNSSLEEKKAATTIKIETTYHPYDQTYPGGVTHNHTPGLRIYMRKHPEFKGSRISPGYVSFCDRSSDGFTPPYDETPAEKCASLNSGSMNLFVGGLGVNKGFGNVLETAEQEVIKYQDLHNALLQKALKDNETKQNDDEVRSVQLENLAEVHPDVKIAMCRPCLELKSLDPNGATGAVFVSLFKHKYPNNSENNMAMVYVVGPKGDQFQTKEKFIEAVHLTAQNVMVALCDYNGLARRERFKKDFQRIKICRICLFSGGLYKHPQVGKRDVAEAILAGLADGYRHGPSPRLNFAYDEDVFKQAWIDTTGLEVVRGETNGIAG